MPPLVPFFERAIQIDPNFAMAYDWLGSAYNDLGENDLGAENLRKAYALRQRVTEHERMDIDLYYHIAATGDLLKARERRDLHVCFLDVEYSRVFPSSFWLLRIAGSHQ